MAIAEYNTEYFTVVALDSAADLWVFTPGIPIDVIEMGWVVTVEVDNTTPGVHVLDHRPTATSDTGRAAIPGATITGAGTDAVGTHHFVKFVAFEVDPGEQVVLEGTTAATAGDGIPYIRYRERPQLSGRNANSTEY